MNRRNRMLIGIACGTVMAFVSWVVGILLARSGISPAETFLDNFTIGSIVALLAYAWLTLQAERQLRERTTQRVKQAVLEERRRIAREFHDTVAQKLAGIVLQLEAGEDHLKPHPAARKYLCRALELAREGLNEAREAVWNLRPEALRSSTLANAIDRLAKDLTKGTPVRVEFSRGGLEKRLPEEIEKDVLRIGQEALNNVVKHAHASKVNVELALAQDYLHLTVEDDGLGFAPEHLYVGSGFGLKGMRERAKLHGGICRIYSQPGQGTKLEAVVPVGPM
jgi:signal transduction histidine kinase